MTHYTPNTCRGTFTAIARSACLAVALGIASSALAQEAPLQESYSTDPYLACEGLRAEIERMDAIISIEATPPATVKIAEQRKKIMNDILKTKTCGEPVRRDFGPDMYDRS